MGRSSDDLPGGRVPGEPGIGRKVGDPLVDSQYPTPPRGGRRGGTGAETAEAVAEEPAETSDLPPGTVLGKYRIIQRLGVGGMGSVYEAIHTGIAKAVALKTMSPQLAADERASARFLREAAAASRLDHPHVVGVTDFGTDAGISYLVMELLRGEDLGEVISRDPGGIEPQRVADIMLAVCAGVFAAHESGVVHRDLKPQNIFLSHTSLGETVPKVLDFGISKMIVEDVNAPLTNTGMVMGTTHYLSPEQVMGKGVDVASDQYALGVILYETLTGQRPHVGSSVYEIMRGISEGNFPPPRRWRADLPGAFEAVVLRAMATRPQDRFESVHGLGRALLALASPKRQVIWADYYDRGRAKSGLGDLQDQGRRPTGGNGTVAMEVRPARSSPTRMPASDFPAAAARPSAARAGLGETRFGGRSEPEIDERSFTTPRPRGAGRWVVVFAVALAAAALFVIAQSPRLRAQLPTTVRTLLERGLSAASAYRASRPGAPEPAPVARPPRAHPGSTTGEGATVPPVVPPAVVEPEQAVVPAAPALPDDSPFGDTTAPFGPPADKAAATTGRDSPPAPAPAGADRGRAAKSETPAGAASDPWGAGPPARGKKRKGLQAPDIYPPLGPPSLGPPNTAPATIPPAQRTPAPPPSNPPPPEQIPAKRYFGPSAAPILE